MAVSAFKSTSKRKSSTYTTASTSKSDKQIGDTSPKKAPTRRSRSVSASSRNNVETASSSSSFSNSRDNPLFWARDLSPTDEHDVSPIFPASNSKLVSSVAENRRGRSVARNDDSGTKVSASRKEFGRSLSRVDTGRRDRSLSRGPITRRQHLNSESEAEQEFILPVNSKNRSKTDSVSGHVKKGGLVRSNSDLFDQSKGLRTWSSQHLLSDPSDNCATSSSWTTSLNWDDRVSSTSSISGTEEKTIKAVCESVKGSCLDDDTTTSDIYETIQSEVSRAISNIQNGLKSDVRSNATAIATTDVADIHLDLINPGAVEFDIDLRREYAKKLEESHERARKLRADLAVEEHRRQELSRILREVRLDPKTPNVQKHRCGRKGSLERRRMSKRLTDEAMTYFDECVSLSTFDSSDFSSQEDPPFNAAAVTTPGASFPQESGNQVQFTNCPDNSRPTSFSSSKVPTRDQPSSISSNTLEMRKSQFSFASKPAETYELQENIGKYIKNFEKDRVDTQVVKSNYYDMDDYSLQDPSKSLLFDRVLLRNRIESGSILLCGGGVAISFFPFASVT